MINAMAALSPTSQIITTILMILTLTPLALSQLPPLTEVQPPTFAPGPAPAPGPAADICNGIFIRYTYHSGKRIPPIEAAKSPKQPYRFQSELLVLNNDDEELKSWKVFVGFQHDEYLVSATEVVLENGTDLPTRVGNGTVFSGFPQADLKTAIQTAGDIEQMSVKSLLVGTEFGVRPLDIPLPVNVSLVNDGYLCSEPTMKNNRTMTVCCERDPEANSTITFDTEYQPRQTGDLNIMYDVTKSYDQNYWAKVTITNHNPLGRLDYWHLSWDWMRGEFINSMKGAYPSIIDPNDCIYGPQSQIYSGLDFSTVLNCYRRTTIVDLPATKAYDTTVGNVPFCCRNGTLLPTSMNPNKSVSSFLINVYKMPPDFNLTTLYPPQNWRINGTELNPDYECGDPIRVTPSLYEDPSGLPTNATAVASWQVVCNITTNPKISKPKCCVSFSAYFNDSIVPCNTCACGCPATASNTRTCSANTPALLIPPEAQLVPFENRTKLTLAWASLKHQKVPNPLPCGDNCPVSLNWHLYTDYSGGWTARLTVFNWDDVVFPEWFVAVQMNSRGKAVAGFEKAYSFNGTVMADVNDTIFLQGLPHYGDYLMGETNGTDPEKDPRVPGKQQSVLSFSKKRTPGILVADRDGFPTKVLFNGEECSLPDYFPMASGGRIGPSPVVLLVALICGFLVGFMGL